MSSLPTHRTPGSARHLKVGTTQAPLSKTTTGCRMNVPGSENKISGALQSFPPSVEICRFTTAQSWSPAFCEVYKSHNSCDGVWNRTGFCSLRDPSEVIFSALVHELLLAGRRER